VHRQLIKDATAVVIKYRDHQRHVYQARERESTDVVEQTYIAEQEQRGHLCAKCATDRP
jgi:hypothetical protein